MVEAITIQKLQDMKRVGEKIVGFVVWDYHMAAIADRVQADIVSVGDSVGVNLWGHADITEVTVDQMVTVAAAARRGTTRALLSCDLPYGPLQASTAAALAASSRLVEEARVDMIKLDDAAEHPGAVAELTQAGIPVWAQFGVTPQTAHNYGIEYSALSAPDAQVSSDMQARLVAEARSLEAAGAVMLDFTNSGPAVGPAVVEAVSIPVIGGFGGGPWLDGRVRMAHAAIGYGIRHLDEDIETYANVAKQSFAALSALVADVRAGRQIKGAASRKR